MSERRYQEVQSRSQVMLLPPCLDDYVSEHNAVRAIDAFVGTLDLQALGFAHAEANCGAGQPAFDPALLLKLYLYGYQHRVRSSRRLEAETRRNLEVIWLCQSASPSYKTIADFRKNNATALRAVNREFVLLCRELSLLGGSRVALDGTYLKAAANVDSFHTQATLERQLKRLDEKIAAYHRQLDEADAQSEECADGAEDPELAAKIEALVERQRHKKALHERLLESGESQVSEVDADARLLSKYRKPVGGYNCQIAVDDKHKLIVAEDVVQDGNDSSQLEPMMTKASEATGSERLVGLADSGYFSGSQLKSCEEKGMEAYVPIPKQAAHKGIDGRFGTDDFHYDAQDDTYVCPAGQRLVRRGTSSNKGKLFLIYSSTAAACRDCPLSDRCVPPSKSTRRVLRWEHEDVMDRHRKKMSAAAPLMRERGSLAEHQFGTLKRWAGMDHFLMRGLGKCRGEFSLMTLSYNFKRVMNELGAAAFAAHCLEKRRLGAIGVWICAGSADFYALGGDSWNI